MNGSTVALLIALSLTMATLFSALFCASAGPAASDTTDPVASDTTNKRGNQDIWDYSREGGWNPAAAASSGLSKVIASAWICRGIRLSRQSYTMRWRCNG